MKKLLLILSLLWGFPLFASTTTTGGTISDSTGQIFANGTWSAQLIGATGQTGPFFVNGVQLTSSQITASGSMNSSGFFTTVLTSNPSITPVGTLWRFTVCPAASSQCFAQSFNIFGASIDLTTSLVPPPISVNANQFSQPSAYQDVEVSGPNLGFTYYNQTSQKLRLCTGNVPCTWVDVGTGGGGGGTLTGSGTVNNFALWNGATSLTDAPMSIFSGVTLSANPFSQPVSLYPCPNSASGTTDGLLVTTDSNGDCINIPDGQTGDIVGVAYSGGGTSGTLQVAQIGTAPVILDNQSTIGDCIVAAATGAQGHDAGTTCPTGVQQIGRVTSLNAGAGTEADARIFISDIQPGSGGSVQTLQVNGTTLAGTLANLNGTTPLAGLNQLLCSFLTDNGMPTSNVALECPEATTSQEGFVKLAQDLGGTNLLPRVVGIQTVPVTFSSPLSADLLCFSSSTALANCSQGVKVRSVSGNSDTILGTTISSQGDRLTNVRYIAASGATAVTLPQAGTAGFASNFTFIATNAQGSGNVVITPTTSTINGVTTLTIAPGTYCFIYSDNTNYFANCGLTSPTSGTVTSVAMTVPGGFSVSGSPITTSGTLGLTTNAAGADYLLTSTAASTSAWEQVNSGSSCGDGTHATSYDISTHKFGCQTISVGTGTVTSIATTSPITGGTITTTGTIACATCVVNNNTNTGTSAMTLDMSASTSAASLRVPNIAGASSTTAGVVSYDTTNKNLHVGANGVDNIGGITPSSISPANNDCVKYTVVSSVVTLNTAGAACGTGTGGGQTTFPLENCTPDTTGLVFWTVNALTNWRDGHWEYSNTIASATHLYCKVKVPHTLPSGTPKIILFNLNANDGTASHTMTFKTCDIIVSTTVNVGALTCQSTQNFTTTSTAYAPSTLTFGVNATLVADSQLIVDLQATTESSLTNNVQLEGAYLEFQ